MWQDPHVHKAYASFCLAWECSSQAQLPAAHYGTAEDTGPKGRAGTFGGQGKTELGNCAPFEGIIDVFLTQAKKKKQQQREEKEKKDAAAAASAKETAKSWLL